MVQIRRIVGDSMLPTLKPGTVIVAVRKKPKVNDIVIVYQADRELVKRVHSIKHNSVDVRGDNEQHSTDSRMFGLVPLSTVQWVVVWPKK